MWKCLVRPCKVCMKKSEIAGALQKKHASMPSVTCSKLQILPACWRGVPLSPASFEVPAEQTPRSVPERPEVNTADATEEKENWYDGKTSEGTSRPVPTAAGALEQHMKWWDYLITNRWRKWTLDTDLISKVLYSQELLSDLLTKSNVCWYEEFKNMTRILAFREERVASSFFQSRCFWKQLSVVEKQMLAKFLTFHWNMKNILMNIKV